MKKMNGMALMLLLVAAPALTAQGRNPSDTGRAARMQRWQGQMRARLGLTEDQATKLKATRERFMPQRRDVTQRMRAIHSALRNQLQPGVAANADSVRKLLDALMQVRVAQVQLDRDQDKELAVFLTPVQRARIEMAYAHRMMRGRMGGHGRGMRGGARGQGWGQRDQSMQPAAENDDDAVIIDDGNDHSDEDGDDDGAGPDPDSEY